MKTTLLALLLLTTLTAIGQTRTLRWEDELCAYTGTYDAKKFTAAQLRNTLKLSQTAGSIPLETNTTAWKISDIATLDVAALDREYAQKSAELKTLDIVNVPYWQQFRERKLREMEQVYRLGRTSIRAYQDPKVLLDHKDLPDVCTAKYAGPLTSGGDELLKTWQMVNEQMRKNNSDPERIRRIYEEQLRSPDRMQFALIEVITFGWSNCTNGLIKYVSDAATPAREFKKLFTRTRTLRCDQP